MYRHFFLLALLFLLTCHSEKLHAQPRSEPKQHLDNIQNQKNPASAIGASLAAPKGTNPEAVRLYQQGLEETEAGNLSQALETLQYALQLDPDYADASAAIGRVYFKMRQWQKAIEYLRRAADLHAKQREAHEATYEKIQADNSTNAATSPTGNTLPQKQDKPNTAKESAPRLSQSNQLAVNQSPAQTANSVENKPVVSKSQSSQPKPPAKLPQSNAFNSETTPARSNAELNAKNVSAPNTETKKSVTTKSPPANTTAPVSTKSDQPNTKTDPAPGTLPPSNGVDAATKVDQSATGVQVAMRSQPVETNSSPVSNAASAPDESSLTKIYRVGPNDILDVQINGSQTLKSTLFTITSSGLLEHPLLTEPLSVSGLTVEEIDKKLEDDLKKRALVDDPKVVVGVRDYGSHSILISGLVKDAGTKFLRREAIPLYVVIADAQPLPEAASVTVVRNEPHQIFEIELSQAADMNLLVRSGDVITLHPSVTQFIYIGGEVKSPGEKTFRRGLTLTQAIITAGGITPNSKYAQITRDDGRGFLTGTRFKVKDIEAGKVLDPVLKPGDRIMILR